MVNYLIKPVNSFTISINRKEIYIVKNQLYVLKNIDTTSSSPFY